MKLYYVKYITPEDEGLIEAFLSKAAAEKRNNQLKRRIKDHPEACGVEFDHCLCEDSVKWTWGVGEAEFPITAEGVRLAFEIGARWAQ